ncbi:MAG: hypothetical protein P0116_11985 [Candidatus Nitrosocosmicus sp.]|nr:hypothetical protein [Candidatus Nitrosocosmicus sp.]
MVEKTIPTNQKVEAKKNEKEIIKTWLTGHHSCTLIIPKDFAKEYDLDEPSHVIVEGTSEGILIRKLKI